MLGAHKQSINIKYDIYNNIRLYFLLRNMYTFFPQCQYVLRLVSWLVMNGEFAP